MAVCVASPITNPPFDPYHTSGKTYYDKHTEWIKTQESDRESRATQLTLVMGLMLVQMGLYYDLWDDAIDKRDDLIDRVERIHEYAFDKDTTVDYTMLKKKQSILDDWAGPVDTRCDDVTMFNAQSLSDAASVDHGADRQAMLACRGMPAGWSNHVGTILHGRAQSAAGSLLAAQHKRREERMREKRLELTRVAQSAARTSLSPVLSGYQQAIGIHEGFASIFAKGFNSAGVGLGTAMGQMSANGTSNSTNSSGGS